MTFLPIVTRELRVAARRRGTYWSRFGAAVAAIGIGGVIMALPDLRAAPKLGMAMFVALSIISFVYSLLAGIFTTADCLSEEKREGTLGLLFLTDLKGYDIVLGKLAATSLNAFYGMLAIFPVMAIPLLAGGVTGAEFWRVVLVSVNNLLFSLAVGMFCSAVSKDERKSVVLAFFVVLFFTALLPLFAFIATRWKEVPPAVCRVSPAFECLMAFDQPQRAFRATKWNVFHQSVGCVHGISWVLLLASAFIVPRVWHDRAESAAGTRIRRQWQRWAHGSAATRLAVRRRLLELNPFYWLTARDRIKAVLVWIPLAGGGLLWAWGLWRYPVEWKDGLAYFWTALLSQTVLKVWIGTEACRRFGADRKSGALELLLATQLSVREILRGQILALLKQFAPPVVVVLLADFAFLVATRNEPGWALTWIAGISVFVADLAALSWVGMWLGLTSRHTNRAAGAAIARVLLLPWVLFGLLWLAFVLLTTAGAHLPQEIEEGRFWISAWALIGLALDVVFGLHARQRLLHDFREVATQRVSGRASRRAAGAPVSDPACIGKNVRRAGSEAGASSPPI